MDLLLQLLIYALVASALYSIIASGLTLTFGVLEFINFAHGDTAMAGGFIFFTFYVGMGLPIIISAILAILGTALLGIIIEKTTFKPVRDKQAFIPLVLSIGVAIIIQSLILMIYGGGSQTYFSNISPKVFHFNDGKISISLVQIIIIISSIIIMSLLYLFLKKTRSGKAIRAVSDNKEIAAIMGINVNKTITILFAIGSGLAAIGGILTAFDQNLHPRMGLAMSIKAFAAITLGGVGKLHGAIIAAIIIGFIENLFIGLTGISASYRELLVFVIFIAVLLFKPYGLFGGKKEEQEISH